MLADYDRKGSGKIKQKILISELQARKIKITNDDYELLLT